MSETFYGLEVPQELRKISERHQQHIAELVLKLRTAGLDEGSIEGAVDQIIASYRENLLAAIKAIGADRG